MYIKNLVLQNYRNINKLFLNPSKNVNIIYGNNGQGKTNILEAIYYFGFLRSFKSCKYSDLLNWDSSNALIETEIFQSKMSLKVKIQFERQKRKVFLNGKQVIRFIDYYNKIFTVFFGQHDLELTQGIPLFRRHFLDRIIFSIDKGYADTARRYRKLLEQRNKLLKSSSVSGYNEMFEIFDSELVRLGSEIVKKRKEVVEHLNSFAGVLISNFNTDFNIKFVYSTNRDFSNFGFLKKIFANDFRRGYTTQGPHSDDMLIEFDNGKNFKRFASQGQHKLISIVLKLCEFEIIKNHYSLMPIMLFDDISSELDKNKLETLHRYVKNQMGQIFITTTSRNNFDFGDNTHFFNVNNGAIKNNG